MSVSMNNSPLLKVDVSPIDRPVSPPATGMNQASIPSHLSTSRTPVHNENVQIAQRQIAFNSDAFTKLFDMLELVFKSMREMLAGKNTIPDTLPDAQKALKAKLETVSQTPVKPDAAPQPALPVVPRPPVSVTNDANGQVKVEVNVNHCHCPGERTEYDKGLRPRISPGTDTAVSVLPMPAAALKSGITPQPVPKVIADDDTKPKADPDLPKPLPDLTCPPPPNNRADRNDQGFNRRTWLRS